MIEEKLEAVRGLANDKRIIIKQVDKERFLYGCLV